MFFIIGLAVIAFWIVIMKEMAKDVVGVASFVKRHLTPHEPWSAPTAPITSIRYCCCQAPVKHPSVNACCVCGHAFPNFNTKTGEAFTQPSAAKRYAQVIWSIIVVVCIVIAVAMSQDEKTTQPTTEPTASSAQDSSPRQLVVSQEIAAPVAPAIEYITLEEQHSLETTIDRDENALNGPDGLHGLNSLYVAMLQNYKEVSALMEMSNESPDAYPDNLKDLASHIRANQYEIQKCKARLASTRCCKND